MNFFIIFFKNVWTFMNKKKKFTKKFQIYMKATDSAESEEKSNFRSIRFLFFELWSFLWHHQPNFWWIFHENSKNKKSENLFLICFSTLHIIHKNRIKTEGSGGVCISLVGKYPINNFTSKILYLLHYNLHRARLISSYCIVDYRKLYRMISQVIAGCHKLSQVIAGYRRLLQVIIRG